MREYILHNIINQYILIIHLEEIILKATGIVLKIDNLGRLVIPKELRKSIDFNEGDSLEIFVDGTNIIIQKVNITKT